LEEVRHEDGVRLVSDAIRLIRPDVVITFGPEGGGSGHGDHKAVSRWTTDAFKRAANADFAPTSPPHEAAKLYWITWPPELDSFRGISGTRITTVVELGSQVNEQKHQAFAEHKTQQDFLDLYRNMLEIFDQKEYFHLAQSRVSQKAPGVESDLLEGVESSVA
jgi:LmbE family N-acetylglucosaminyl deacetylase